MCTFIIKRLCSSSVKIFQVALICFLLKGTLIVQKQQAYVKQFNGLRGTFEYAYLSRACHVNFNLRAGIEL